MDYHAMNAPYKPEVIERQNSIIACLIGRPEGATFDKIGAALGITQGGTSYRVIALVANGKAWTCRETRSAKKRAFSTREAMKAWQAAQPPSYLQVVQDLLSIKQPVTAAELGKAVGIETKRAAGYLRPMERRGEIFGYQAGHMWFWYKTADDAKKGKARADAELARLMAKRTEKAMVGRGRKMKSEVPAGVVLYDRSVSFRERDAVITSHTKVTIAPAPKYTGRWQQQPDSGQSIFADRPGYGA